MDEKQGSVSRWEIAERQWQHMSMFKGVQTRGLVSSRSSCMPSSGGQEMPDLVRKPSLSRGLGLMMVSYFVGMELELFARFSIPIGGPSLIFPAPLAPLLCLSPPALMDAVWSMTPVALYCELPEQSSRPEAGDTPQLFVLMSTSARSHRQVRTLQDLEKQRLIQPASW